jgi:Ca-activated chloride channel family protein
VIDISGDGFNNSGRTMRDGRELARGAGVIVNGLAIQNQVLDLGGYFEEYVITGPGSFVITAEDYQDYVKAIRRKLLREIRAGPIS